MATINADVYKKLLAQYGSTQALANAIMNKYGPNSPEYQAINDYIGNPTTTQPTNTQQTTSSNTASQQTNNSVDSLKNAIMQGNLVDTYGINKAREIENTLGAQTAARLRNGEGTSEDLSKLNSFIQSGNKYTSTTSANTTTNPNGYTDPNNLAYYNSLSDSDKKKFDTWYNASKLPAGQERFDEIKSMLTSGVNYDQILGTDTSLTSKQKENTPYIEGVDQSKITGYQTEFDKSWNKFIEESKNVYGLETAQQLEKYRREGMDIETAQNKLNTQYGWKEQDLSTKYSQSLTQYDWQTQNLNTQLARNQADYATYTSQNQQDFNYNIASQNKDYSKALSSASNAYGQRGILKSGIAKQQAQEATQEFSNEQAYFKTLNQRKLDEASLTLGRTTEDINKNLGQLGTQKGWTTEEYNTNQARLGTQKGWSATDYATQTGRLAEDKATLEKARQAGSDVLGINLQAQGDVVYNQGIQQYYQLLQAQKEQEAINKLYGTTTTATKIPYRVGGKYTL